MGGSVRKSSKRPTDGSVGGLNLQGTRANDPVPTGLLDETTAKDPTRPEDQDKLAAAEEKRQRKAAKLKQCEGKK